MRFKLFLIISSTFLFTPALLLPLQTGDNTKILATKYAAFQAALQVIKQWKLKDMEGILDHCTPENFKRENLKRKDGENNLYGYVKNRLEEKIYEDLKSISRSFFGNKEAELFAEIKKKFRQKINKSVHHNLEVKYRDIFKKSREKAISKQVRELSQDIYPDPMQEHELLKAFENAFVNHWKQISTDRLREKLKSKIESRKNILEEVKGLKGEIIEEILKDIRTQMENQQNTLRKEPQQRYKTWSQIENVMIQNVKFAVNSDVNKTREIVYYMPYNGETIRVSKKINRVIYDIFEFVKKKIKREAKIKEKERFKQFCKQVEFKVWTRGELNATIVKYPEIHKNDGHSADVMVDRYFFKAQKVTIAEYIKNLQIGNKDKEMFIGRLQQYLKEPNIISTVKGRCKALISSDLTAVRNGIAREQLIKYFPKLHNETWEAPKLAGIRHRNKPDIMKRIKIDSDPAPAHPDDCFQPMIFKDIRKGKLNRKILLDNTEKMVLEKVKRLIDEARRAWDGQWDIYCKHPDYIKDGFQRIDILKMIEKEKRKVHILSKQKLIDRFKKIILDIWTKNRKSLIWNGKVQLHKQKKYVTFFAYIDERIDNMLEKDVGKILKNIRDEIQNEIAKRKEKEAREAETKKLKIEGTTERKGKQTPGKGDNGKYGKKVKRGEIGGNLVNLKSGGRANSGSHFVINRWLFILLVLIIIIQFFIILYLTSRGTT